MPAIKPLWTLDVETISKELTRISVMFGKLKTNTLDGELRREAKELEHRSYRLGERYYSLGNEDALYPEKEAKNGSLRAGKYIFQGEKEMRKIYAYVYDPDHQYEMIEIGTIDEEGCHVDGLWIGETKVDAEKVRKTFNDSLPLKKDILFLTPHEFISLCRKKSDEVINEMKHGIYFYAAQDDQEFVELKKKIKECCVNTTNEV